MNKLSKNFFNKYEEQIATILDKERNTIFHVKAKKKDGVSTVS